MSMVFDFNILYHLESSVMGKYAKTVTGIYQEVNAYLHWHYIVSDV